jgi:NAD(P) transhydrogenase subunit alpha
MDYHVAAMKPGSVIVDLAASTGGNCGLTRNGEVYTTDNGVTMVGKLNQLPSQASQLYGNNLCHLLDDMGKADKWKIDMEDAVVSRAMVTYNGKINWPPAPLPVSPTAGGAKKIVPPTAEEVKISDAEKSKKETISMFIRLAVVGALLLFVGKFAPPEFIQHFTVFILAVFVGWQLISNVSHSLHTPLMAVTNAISGIIVIGGLLQTTNDFSNPMTILAFIAILVASINIVGGFVVTHRMLNMFKK